MSSHRCQALRMSYIEVFFYPLLIDLIGSTVPWNGWEPTLYGNFPNINLTTLDKNPNGQQTIVN
ncbi:hypothetical protein [Capnocytophaga canimorsus]|uniref:hypothetical protein n=1 Tax=Capnocytophaga canimorsus TaxID=28188 RepID=UPI0018E30FD5|nr:hypothetical protein [Capnocytophaga canimorsus]